jgi:ABC-type iron transport system FetAB permease component
VCAMMRLSEVLQPMLNNILLVILGLVLIALLTAIFEALGLKNHPYVARILAAVCIVVVAYGRWRYHAWWEVLLVIGIAFAHLRIMREFQQSRKKSQ